MWQGDVTFGDSLVISLIGMIVVMLELVVLAVLIVALSKIIRSLEHRKPAKAGEAVKTEPAAVVNVADSSLQVNTKSDGSIDVQGVSDEQAAVIMSVVSAECGLPLDKLSFKSIKKVN